MDFLISNTHISPVYLVIIGFIIGVLGGFFGVGGSFLAGPALFAVGVPMNFVVGTDLAHIVGKSIVASKKHRALGNVDLKLGLIMVIGTISGVELGAQLIQRLKGLGQASVDKVIGITFVIVLISISAFVAWESWQTIKMQRRSKRAKKKSVKEDESAFDHIAKKIHSINIPPMIKLPVSGVERVSLWAILSVAFAGGLASGFLGGGAGYIRMPSLVYVLGIPTHVAVGTDLFEVVISASYGTLTHAIKGNVDIVIALVMHTGAAIGAQIGAASTQYYRGPKIRLAFVPLPLIGAALIIYGLLTGRQMK
ncbi:MAG TPA: sulfite exporter TauE/SafE family protein [Blastocatellia bacterium]|jgi:hypothetical protein